MAKSTERTLLAATTDAANSSQFEVNVGQPHTVIVSGLAGVEVATLKMFVGGAAVSVSDDSGVITCTATKNSFLIEGPGVYFLAKDATVGAVAVIVIG